MQHARVGQRVLGAHRDDRVGRRWAELRAGCLEHDLRVALEVRDAFGGERGDRDHRVGPTDRPAGRHLLPDATRPAEGARLVEQREIVHGGHRRRARSQRQVDIERVHEIGRAGRAQALDRPAHPVAVASRQRGHTRAELRHRARLHHGDEIGIELSGQRAAARGSTSGPRCRSRATRARSERCAVARDDDSE